MSSVTHEGLIGATGRSFTALVPRVLDRPAAARGQADASGKLQPAACFHCGEPCYDRELSRDGKAFCCQGCLFVHDLLEQSGLGQFYQLDRHPGVRIRQGARREQWAYLDDPALQERLLDFTDGKLSRITLQIPAIHCVACVWLLENLFRLHAGVGRSQVNFPRREATISFSPEKLRLSELVGLLASIGYEPVLTLGELEKRKSDPARKRQWLQVGIAGFAFGNIMLLSLPGYLGLDSLSGPLCRLIFGYLSLALAAPVVFYSASHYWRSAGLSLRRRVLTLDVPIALGLAALYGTSAFDIALGRGPGYLDSLAGLVFFLLCGRVFQQKTYDRLAFDRDFKSFFPLSVTRTTAAGEESVPISSLRVGDRLRLRNSELIPADARLVGGPACIDYSFVTGEAEPVTKEPGDYLYAGGRQSGGAIEVETVKAVSQSRLTSLWDHEAFRKERESGLNTLTTAVSRWFTLVVIAVAVGAGAFWLAHGEAGRALKAFISVLIVACPCALALAAPFTFGTAQRLLARLQVFLKNGLVLERMAQVDTIVFDKTGTLTEGQAGKVRFVGRHASPRRPCDGGGGRLGEASLPCSPPPELVEPAVAERELPEQEKDWVAALARHSTHPLAARIGEELGSAAEGQVENYTEVAGCGIEGRVEGHEVRLGAEKWVRGGEENIQHPTSNIQHPMAEGAQPSADRPPMPLGHSADRPQTPLGHSLDAGCWMLDVGCSLSSSPGSAVWLAIDGTLRGAFMLSHTVRPETDDLLRDLGSQYDLALLSGDNEKERERFRALFGDRAALQFNQGPLDKLSFIRRLQDGGKVVMMVGDGLNDAGALKQSDVGVAVVEKAGAFSPASDVILASGQVPRLARMLQVARSATRIVRLSFGISFLYNAAGIGVAAAGILSPLVSAVLMPLSSISVVLFACGATRWAAARAGLTARP
ncbi:MAG TPA: heavy metal translocating P-type ATPase metal-binding domain-containing protein [Candidatus Acidoferrum sp.]|nr:heavy metal translocating P-type ATPase metal-binding domain-containing protein [Candidatus Acidoferrum sp.]